MKTLIQPILSKKSLYLIGCYLLIPAFLLLQQLSVQAQQLSKSFTVNDGLPSNLIYSMVQDDKGFLWIGTDNGVARFDGKYFRLFTTDDGLPDNEILEVRKEKDGTIWVNTFKQGPLYFDENLNRFVDPLAGININKDFIKMVLHVRTLDEGGIVFYSYDRELVFKNRKYVQLPYKAAFSYPDGESRAYLYSELRTTGKLYNNYVYYHDDNRRDSMLLYTLNGNDNYYVKFLSDNKLYLLTRKGKFYIVGYNKRVSKFEIKTITINENLNWFRVTDKRINILTSKGNIYVYNRTGLFEHYSIADKDYSNSICEDNQKNIWVGTLNKGLRLYKLNYIELIKGDKPVDENYLSILATANGNIYAGNYFGDILEINKNGKRRVIRPFGSTGQIWVRSIISAGNKTFAISEGGVIVDFKRKIYLGKEDLQRVKDAAYFNDSIIIAGGVDERGALFKINTKTEKATILNSGLVRIAKVVSFNKRYVYCATNEGLYKYDYETDRIVNDFKNTPLSSERILEVQTTYDGLLLAATSTKGVYVLKDDKIIKKLDKEALINNTVTDIVSTPNHSIWLSTRNGLSRIIYNINGNEFNYKTDNFSMTEGLPANVILGISYRNDTIFLATEKGVAFLPERIQSQNNSIKTFLTNIKINHENVPINPTNTYKLDYPQRSVWLEFSGIDLGGHLKRIEYTLDKGKGWINLETHDLSLELSAGNHRLFVRAVDINGSSNNPELVLDFIVALPFYLNPWFITFAAGIVAGMIVLVYYRMKIATHKRHWANELKIEQERNRITADLHDEIGSTISSLQIYSDIAHNLVDKNREEAKNLLKKISDNTSKISENISDIIWSMKPNGDFSLSPAARIKNIVSDVLGPTDIKYEVNADAKLDAQISCIICRKNLILIVKEAINNILKYSGAKQVSISLLPINDKAVLTIKDDGKGMNVEDCIRKGNGLGNMKRRTEEIGGELQIISAINEGTTIVSKFPVIKNSELKIQ